MNRYFYVPVMDSHIKHDGLSLRDHLKVVDYELFERECKHGESTENYSFLDEDLSRQRRNNKVLSSCELNKIYQERMIPRSLVLVFSDEGFYELATNENMDPISEDYLLNFEMDGESVVDVFVDNSDYAVHAENFFQIFQEKKDSSDSKEKTSFGRKVMQKLPFLSRKNS